MEISNFIFIPSSLTVIINILPIISFLNFFFSKENFETIPIARIVANYMNSLAFFFYSSIIFNIEVRFANLVSAIISLILMLVYFYLELSRYFLDSVLNFIILVMGTSCCYQWLSKIIIEEKIVGRIYLITNLTSIIIQMQYIYNGISKKNYLLIPITYDSISFPHFFSWIIYGFLIKDFYITTANGICIFVNLVQILLYFHFRKQYLSTVNEETSIEIGEETKKEKEFNSVEEMKERPVKIESNPL
jgi:hypothetical protein